MHAHTSGISRCCRIPADKVIEFAKNSELDGIAITNHYQKSYVSDGKDKLFAEAYIEEYKYTIEIGDRQGVMVFPGIELSPEKYPSVHILIYGVSDDFILKNSKMYDYTQKELYEKVKEAGGAMIQAHPFRNGTSVLNVSYLDGIEINCHPLYQTSYSDEILEIAEKNNLTVTCGGDFHADTYRPKCGVYLPDFVKNSVELGEYILNSPEIRMCVQEPNQKEIKEIRYINKQR